MEKIDKTAIVYENVETDDCYIGPYCIIGERLAEYYTNKKYKNPKTIIGKGAVIRSGTVIYAGCKFGRNFTTGNNAVIREYSEFGDNCSFGVLSQSDGYISVGNGSRFHNNVFLSQYTKIGNHVRIYPNVTTLESLHPPCKLHNKESGVVIEDYAIIGASSTILPRVKIGKNSFVGAGSLVKDDVPEGKLVNGNPAKVICDVSEIKCKTGKNKQPYPWHKE